MSDILKPTSRPSFSLTWRFLCVGDAADLMRLRHQAICEAPTYFGTPEHVELAKTIHTYRRQLKRSEMTGTSAILGVWREKELIGMAGIKIRRLQNRKVGLIYSMYVRKSQRGQGIGKSLVLKAREEIYPRWGLTQCQLNVEVGNETALRLYQSCGFRIVGKEERAFWIDHIPHDVYVLE